MTDKNIQMKIKNGADWDNLYPKTKVGLIDGLVDQVTTLVAGEVEGKVDKVDGKQLSTEDYTSDDKTKLAGIASGANNYTHPTGDGNTHVPATGTTNNGKVLTAGATAGSAAWADLPAAGSKIAVSTVEPTNADFWYEELA